MVIYRALEVVGGCCGSLQWFAVFQCSLQVWNSLPSEIATQRQLLNSRLSCRSCGVINILTNQESIKRSYLRQKRTYTTKKNFRAPKGTFICNFMLFRKMSKNFQNQLGINQCFNNKFCIVVSRKVL